MRTRKQRKRLINWRIFYRVLGLIGLLLMISSFFIVSYSNLPNAKPYQFLIRISPLIFGFAIIIISMLQISDINRNINIERTLLYRKKVSRYFSVFAKLISEYKFDEAEKYFEDFLNYDTYFNGYFANKCYYARGVITGIKFNGPYYDIQEQMKKYIVNFLSE